MRVTKITRPFPLSTSTSLGGGGGTISGTDPDTGGNIFPGSGQVPTSSGSNTWAWGSNVARITSNTSNALAGPFVNFASGSGISFAVSSNTLTISGSGSGSSLPWFNVKSYGATGDGTTNDTSAINSAIAALNAADRGVLYFPAGTYKTTTALTAISAGQVIVRGDGMASYLWDEWGSSVVNTSSTAVLFTINSRQARFENIGLLSNSGGTPSAGAGILVDSSDVDQRCDFDQVHVRGFYDDIDVKVGAHWTMTNSVLTAPVRYGIRIRNTVNVDAGDWVISGCYIATHTYNATSAIRVESSGGGKIVATKINEQAAAASRFTTGIDVNIGAGNATSVMTITGCSIENVTGDAVLIATTSTGQYGLTTITGLQVGLYANNTGRAVKISAATNGTFGTGGSISGVIIDGLVARTDGTARAAIELVNSDRVTLGDIQLTQNFTSRYTSSGDTNTTDGASSGTTSPLTTKGDLWGYSTTNARFAVGSNGTTVIADSTQTLGLRYSVNAPSGEILITDTPAGSPLVFADLVQNELQDDLLYGDL